MLGGWLLVMMGADILGLSTHFELLFFSLVLEPAKESLAKAKGICCFTSPLSPLDSLVAEKRCEFEARFSLSFLRELFEDI